ncbi:hypothetical protein, variant 3 [Phialophora macrospora]|uniref:Velvet domain-containing protein n=1 Tax=Phialophora macrospora TaxID=1851006 RepID=A0A0D2GL14_9EURO|nr:hypothetical protein, variant 3 [Phialophora macrospora]
MTTAIHSSSFAAAYVHGGQHYPRYFSLTTPESEGTAMQPNPGQRLTPVSTVNSYGQYRSSTSTAAVVASQPSPASPVPTLPPLSIPPHFRSVTDHIPEVEQVRSPLSQRSMQSTAAQSPVTKEPLHRRLSHETSPPGSAFVRSYERLQNYDLSTGSPAQNATAAATDTAPEPIPSSLPPIHPWGIDPSRISLHIRQQPRAVRAGPDGKDRRAIDPPPILQLLIADFDPDCAEDVAETQCPFWVVHCKLVGAYAPETDVSTQSCYNEYGRREVQRLLLGTTVAGPHHTQADPDPPTMPAHPTTKPPSPTARFLQGSTTNKRQPHEIPGAFFIFADISLRKAGEYRLLFTLMKMGCDALKPGSRLPFISVVVSDMFRAVNAKDFDQVHPSTPLAREKGGGDDNRRQNLRMTNRYTMIRFTTEQRFALGSMGYF